MGIVKGLIPGETLIEDNSGKTATITDMLIDIPAGINRICSADAEAGQYDLGDPHPCVTGLQCVERRIDSDPMDNTKYRVNYVFRVPDDEATAGGKFSMSGSLAGQATTRDRNDAQVELEYTYPAAPNYKDFTLAGQTRKQIAQLEVNRPTLVLRWTRLQSAFATAWGNRAILGTVNSAVSWGFAAETLLCTRMEIDQSNTKWRETFEFQYTGKPWTAYAIFLQEDDNRPVTIPDAKAEKNVDVYPTYNYALVGLTLPT